MQSEGMSDAIGWANRRTKGKIVHYSQPALPRLAAVIEIP